MTQRHNWPFTPLTNTTAPAFMSSAIEGTAATYALEATTTGRIWQGPSGRSVRLTEINGVDYFVNFGTASTLTLASTVDSMLVLGGVSEVFQVHPNYTHISMVSAGTTLTVNVTLGYGQ